MFSNPYKQNKNGVYPSNIRKNPYVGFFQHNNINKFNLQQSNYMSHNPFVGYINHASKNNLLKNFNIFNYASDSDESICDLIDSLFKTNQDEFFEEEIVEEINQEIIEEINQEIVAEVVKEMVIEIVEKINRDINEKINRDINKKINRDINEKMIKKEVVNIIQNIIDNEITEINNTLISNYFSSDYEYININAEKDYLYNKNLSCAKCNISYQTLEPRFFSFNSPQGACISCSGLGVEMKIDADLLVPDQKKSLLSGCLLPIGEQPKSNWIGQIVASLLKEYNIPYSMPWYQLPSELRRILLYGTNKKDSVKIEVKSKNFSGKYSGTFEGIIKNLERRYTQTKSNYSREWIEKFMAIQPCSVCGGGRLQKKHLSVYINDLNIYLNRKFYYVHQSLLVLILKYE